MGTTTGRLRWPYPIHMNRKQTTGFAGIQWQSLGVTIVITTEIQPLTLGRPIRTGRTKQNLRHSIMFVLDNLIGRQIRQ